ncbi:hypothetical protein [Paracoccus sp. SSK6]|uniref:hypothetical protein n=1 Tax=Paracoccus sp. SSK6 TaxID=3143131 RepID=UPI0032191A61
MIRNLYPTHPLPDERIEEIMHGRPEWLTDYVKLIHEQRRNFLDDVAQQMADQAA